MMLLRPFVIVALVMLTTCEADRLRKLELQMNGMKAVQSYVMTRLDTIEGDFGLLTDRVSKLESLVNTSESDNRETGSSDSRTGYTVGNINTKPEINDIIKTLTMYKHSFKKHKKELVNVNNVFKDTLSAFVSNASTTISSLVNIVNDDIQKSAENISATLQKVNNTVAESRRKLRSDSFIYLNKFSSEVRTDIGIQFEGEKQEINTTLLAFNSQVREHVANETDTLDRFKTNILQDLYAAQTNVQNDTIKMEKKVEELIGRANEVVGIIEEQRSTIEDGIMVTIKALHIFWSDWSSWSDCSGSSDRGSRNRHRSCVVYPPFTDDTCIGNDTETEFYPSTLLYSPDDCSDVLNLGLSRGSGVYTITPWNTHREVAVYCDMDTEGGGWTVFQRRWDGSVAFNRSFVDYERGFGSLDGEFWTGLSLLHSMTSRAYMTLHIDVGVPNGTTGFDEYSGFYISPPDRYSINVDRRINSERSGIFRDSTIHDLDMGGWIIGSRPTSVFAHGRAHKEELKAASDNDQVIVVVTYENGAISVIDNGRWCPFGYDQRFEVLCEKMQLSVENKGANHVISGTDKGMLLSAPEANFMRRYPEAYANELKHFLDVLEGKDVLRIRRSVTIQAMGLADLFYESLRTKAAVPYTDLSC